MSMNIWLASKNLSHVLRKCLVLAGHQLFSCAVLFHWSNALLFFDVEVPE